MPRKARIDAPGALHHVIVKGIERRKFFRSDYDRRIFLKEEFEKKYELKASGYGFD